MTTKELIKDFNGKNRELIASMESCKSIQEAFLIAKDYGVTDSKDVFYVTMKNFKKAVDDISFEDSKGNIVGATTTEIVSAVSTYTAAAATAGSAAAV